MTVALYLSFNMRSVMKKLVLIAKNFGSKPLEGSAVVAVDFNNLFSIFYSFCYIQAREAKHHL